MRSFHARAIIRACTTCTFAHVNDAYRRLSSTKFGQVDVWCLMVSIIFTTMDGLIKNF